MRKYLIPQTMSVEYLVSIKAEETFISEMRNTRVSDAREQLEISVMDAKATRYVIHMTLEPYVWKNDAEFPKILGGGYIVNYGGGGLGDGMTPGSGEYSPLRFLISCATLGVFHR